MINLHKRIKVLEVFGDHLGDENALSMMLLLISVVIVWKMP